MNLKCCPCLDQAIAAGQDTDLASLPDACTLAPVLQAFAAGGQQVMAAVPLPVCLACRKGMLVTVSKNGLVTA